MKLTGNGWLRAAMRVGLCVVMVCALALPVQMAAAQAISTTTVQGTVYLANGQPGAGTLVVSWPSFTTAAGQKVAADKITVTIPADGFVSVNLAPNQGATPAGEFYTAVFYMSDGTTNTEYWVIPAAAQASLAQVEAQVMPAAQAVQSVSKAYVDQAVAEALGNHIDVSGGNLTGPLYLSGDPTQPLQAADKHYVDQTAAQAVPLAGGNMTGGLTTPAINGVQAPAAGSTQTTLQAVVNAAGTNGAVEIPPTYAGTDTFTNANGVRVTDLRTSGAQQTARSVKEFGAVCDGVTDDTSALQAAIDYAHTHNVALTIPEGICKTRPLNWHGESISGISEQDSALMGFPGQDVLMTMPDSSTLMANTRIHDLTIYVDQSLDTSCSPAEGRAAGGNCQYSRPIENNSIFSNGGSGQTDSTGTGAGWWVGNCAIAMPATTGAGGNGLRNATIENVKIVTTGTDPMAAQYQGAHSTHTCGIYLAQWPQWSEFRNIDIQGLNTGIAIPALPVATPASLTADSNRWQNITIEAAHAFTAAAGSNNVLDNVVAMAGNSAATGEPPTGIVLDLPSGDQGWTVRNVVVQPTWDAVQPQLTVTTSGGAVTAVTVGSEHGLGFDPYGTQAPLAFSSGCTAQATASVNSDGSIGSASVTQGGTGCSSTTTASVNEPGTWDTAAPVNLIGGQNMSLFAGSLLKGNGGYTVWDASGSQSYGTQLAGGGGNLPGGGSYPGLVASTAAGSTFSGTTTVKNQADAEIDSTLWAGLTTPQKEAFLYKDWNGNSQWYMEKDASNDWALKSAVGGLDSFKAYQSGNSGDTYIDAGSATGHIRLNYESGSGAETDIYSGSSSNLDAAFLGPASIKFPGLAASSGTDCLQIDNSGYISNTGSPCGSGSGGATGTINSGNSGQIAYYTANGTALSGMSTVPVSAGGTGASTAPTALANLLPGAAADGSNGLSIAGNVGASASITKASPVADIRAYGGVGDGVADTGPALRAAFAAIKNTGGTIYIPDGSWNFSSTDGSSGYVLDARNAGNIHLKCAPGADITVASSISPGAFIAIGEYYGLEEASGYTINAIPDPGAVTLTLTTASDAGNFSVGQAIYIMGGPGTESQGDGEINWVTSVNATTGVIGLLKPTGKPFTGTGSSTLHVVPAPSNAFAYDLSVTGCHATLNNGDFVYLYESIHTLIADNNVTLPATASRGMMINSYYPLADLTVKNNRYVGGSSQIIQLADGWRDINIEGNDFTSQGGQAVLNPSEGVENLTIAHNHLYQVVPSTGVSGNTATIMFSTAYNVTVNDNSIQLDNESSNVVNAITMGLSNGHCTHCSVTGNVIQLSSPASTNSTAILGSGGPASIVGNTIYTSGYGIQPNAGSTVTGNTIYLTGSVPKSGITIANDSVIVGNRIYGTGTAAGSGIGYPTNTGPAVVAGNMISDVQQAFNAASSNSILFANNVCDNVSNSTYCNELDWNGDTNLYRSAAGILKTDGELDANILSVPTGNIITLNSTTVNATTGYKCNGVYGASGTYLESTGSGCAWGTVAGGSLPNAPAWLLWQGDGSGGALNCTSGTCYATGDNWYSSVNIASGATLAAHYYSGAPLSYATMPLIIRSTGTCTIAGTISVSPNTSGDGLTGSTFGGGSGGGGGGGTNAGSGGSAGNSGNGNGAGGAAGGGIGGSGNMGSFGGQLERGITSQGVSLGNFYNRAWGGAAGGTGGSSGGAGGTGGGVVILDCQAIDFTGTIDVSGAAGGDSTGNNIGAGGGGGGGFVIMRSQNLTNSGTINVSGGAGGSCGSYTGCGAGGGGADGWSEVFTH